jgi:hypothetical protein
MRLRPTIAAMVLRLILALSIVIVAGAGCGGDEPVTPDAKSVDAIMRACDGRAYDPCMDTTNGTDCMQPNQTCRFFMQQNITICSPACDTNTPCPPDENGVAVSCNMMGRCRSNAANTCAR